MTTFCSSNLDRLATRRKKKTIRARRGSATRFGELDFIRDDEHSVTRYPGFDPSGNLNEEHEQSAELIQQQIGTAFGELKQVDGDQPSPSQSFLAEQGGWRDPATGLSRPRRRR